MKTYKISFLNFFLPLKYNRLFLKIHQNFINFIDLKHHFEKSFKFD